MKIINNLLNQRTAQKTASFMKVICHLAMVLFTLMLLLSFFGRLQYNLSFQSENYPHAIYAEENHDFTSRSFTVKSQDDLRVHTTATDGKIALSTYATIVLILSLNIIPLIFAFWFLSKVFGNVSKGDIFIKKNAHYLLYYALIQATVAIVAPFVKLLIVGIANNVLISDRISLGTRSNMLNQLIPSIAIFVAAYIISYGVHLQDEADHTL